MPIYISETKAYVDCKTNRTSRSRINRVFKTNRRFMEGKYRYSKGFSLIEQLLGLLIVAFTAVLLIRMSAANALVSQQSARRLSAMRMSSELAAWIQRGGHLALGVSIDQALNEVRTGSAGAASSAICCPPEGCDARSSAWQYLTLWQSRLVRSIPDARLIICSGEIDALSVLDWSCASEGSVLLMKLGWPTFATTPYIVMPLGAAQ